MASRFAATPVPTVVAPADAPLTGAASESDRRLLARLHDAFGHAFAVYDTKRGELDAATADWPRVDVFRWAGVLEHVARRGQPEIVEDFAPLLLAAAPLEPSLSGPHRVAVAVLLTQPSPTREALAAAGPVFGADADELHAWSRGRREWPPHTVQPLLDAVVAHDRSESQAAVAKRQLAESSANLLATFEELDLLHRLAEGLSVGRGEEEIASEAAHWLADVVNAESVFVRFTQSDGRVWLRTEGVSPIAEERLSDLLAQLGPNADARPIALNRDRTSSPTWAVPEVREVVSAPIVTDDGPIGHVVAVNFRKAAGRDDWGFGSIESSLLGSVATLIGVHASNRRSYGLRTALFQNTIHTLSAAIDAKDPYTCGHSDRVARIAVRLAQQLGLSEADQNTIYLGGLLHDVGKIGIDDHVLRKPGRLTEEEYDHVKSHPELGERILGDVPELRHIMPLVRHHHEAWDGSGYPDGLVGEACERLARVLAVADAIDAMGSDRPYRKGMPAERMEAILQDGRGGQWDPEVIDAYFAAREDIQAIARVDREPLDLDVASWDVASWRKPQDAAAEV